MPALLHCVRSGGHKARISRMRVGAWTYAFSFGEAHGLRIAASNLGLRAAVNRMRDRGESTYRVTLLPSRTSRR